MGFGMASGQWGSRNLCNGRKYREFNDESTIIEAYE
jgi:hypothetical protein